MKQVEPIRNLEKIAEMRDLLLDAAKTREAVLLVLGVNAGLRISDLLALRWKDLRAESFRVKERKTGKGRRVVINESMRAAIDLIEDNQPGDDFVFASESNRSKGTPWTREYAWRILKEYAEKAGIRTAFGTHTLRKTFGFALYQAGHPVEYIQKLLNHSSPAITLRYIGIEQETLDSMCMELNLG